MNPKPSRLSPLARAIIRQLIAFSCVAACATLACLGFGLAMLGEQDLASWFFIAAALFGLPATFI